MNYTSFVDTFNLFTTCYIYGATGYILILFVLHLYSALSSLCNDQESANQASEADFYTQVKDLLNPAIEDVFEPVLEVPQQVDFEAMTIRELRSHIRDNQLHEAVRTSLGKTISNARKSELIDSLQLI